MGFISLTRRRCRSGDGSGIKLRFVRAARLSIARCQLPGVDLSLLSIWSRTGRPPAAISSMPSGFAIPLVISCPGTANSRAKLTYFELERANFIGSSGQEADIAEPLGR
jgi:hypothetical protein